MSLLDSVILGFDRSLKTLTGTYVAARPSPADEMDETELEREEREHAAALMRVNHTGEVCAQALYEGQAVTARDPSAREALLNAAEEERDHLKWCKERVNELGSHTSVLDPVFYGLSFAMGAATGLLGDKVSLGFVEATEDQVVQHLDRHMDALPEEDAKSRAIVATMREDEARHGSEALEMGGEKFPTLVKEGMTLISRVMTETTYRV